MLLHYSELMQLPKFYILIYQFSVFFRTPFQKLESLVNETITAIKILFVDLM